MRLAVSQGLTDYILVVIQNLDIHQQTISPFFSHNHGGRKTKFKRLIHLEKKEEICLWLLKASGTTVHV